MWRRRPPTVQSFSTTLVQKNHDRQPTICGEPNGTAECKRRISRRHSADQFLANVGLCELSGNTLQQKNK